MSARPTAQLGGDTEKASKTEAAYLRIARVLSERILNGEHVPGGQLPTERQLAKEFGVSLMTLRRAMQVLEERGLTSSQQGRGTFVRLLGLGQAVFGLHQWSEQWTREETQVKLLEASSRPASEPVARMLGCNPGERTLFLRRLLVRDGEPITYNWEYLVFDPRRPLVETQLRVTSLGGPAPVGCWACDVRGPPQDISLQLDAGGSAAARPARRSGCTASGASLHRRQRFSCELGLLSLQSRRLLARDRGWQLRANTGVSGGSC